MRNLEFCLVDKDRTIRDYKQYFEKKKEQDVLDNEAYQRVVEEKERLLCKISGMAYDFRNAESELLDFAKRMPLWSQRLHQRGQQVIISTHDEGMVSVCDYVIQL